MSAIASFIPTDRISACMDKMTLRSAMLKTSQLIKTLEKESQKMRCSLEKASDRMELYHSRLMATHDGATRRSALLKKEEWAIRAETYEAVLCVAMEETDVQVERYRLMNERYCALRDRPRLLTHHALARIQERERIQEPVQEQQEQQEGTPFHVHLLSGDILTVHVDMNRPVSTFADEFVRQNRYHPSSVHRTVFLIQKGEEEEEEEKEKKLSTVFWSPEERRIGLTYRDLFPEEQSLPLLHLFVRPMDQKDVEEKLTLLRTILCKEKRYNMYQDDELFALYSNWHLTFIPQGQSNRYLTLHSFVEAHPETFWTMTVEEQERSMEWNRSYLRVREFNTYLIDSSRRIQRNNAYHVFAEQRAQLLEIIRTHRERKDGMATLMELDANLSLRSYFTLTELHEYGVPVENLVCNRDDPSRCFIKNYSHWASEAQSFTFLDSDVSTATAAATAAAAAATAAFFPF